MRKRIVKSILSLGLVAVLAVGATIGHGYQRNEEDALAGWGYVWFANSERSWDLDKVTPYTSSPYNSNYQTIDGSESGFEEFKTILNNRIHAAGEDVGKAHNDYYLAMSFAHLQNNSWRTYEYEEKNVPSITDYKALRDHGCIMTPETSFYWGITATPKMSLKTGDTQKIIVNNAPTKYGKLIRTTEHTASPDGVNPGPLCNEAAYFVSPKWSSSNDDVATVNSKGLVKAVGKGKAKIRVQYDIWVTCSDLKFENDEIVAQRYLWKGKWNTYEKDTGGNNEISKYGEADRYSVIRTCDVTVK